MTDSRHPPAACTHNTPALSPAAVDELADLLHPATTAPMLATLRRLATDTGTGPIADGWQLLADALTTAHHIAVVEDRHRGRTP